MNIGPNHIHVVEVDEVFSADIALELDRAFDRGEFVPNLDILVVDTDAFVRRVPNSMGFLKGQISFHVRGVVVGAMT